MAATTTTITFDFTKTNPVKRWQFNANGASSYFFSDNTITGPTSQTVSDGSLFKISRSDDQYDGLTEGSGAYIYTEASLNELLGITSENTFVKNLIIVPYFNTKTNYSGMNTSALESLGEAGRWITTKNGHSEMYRGRIKFVRLNNEYTITGTPGATNNISGLIDGGFHDSPDPSSLADMSGYSFTGYSSIFGNNSPFTYQHPNSGTIYNDYQNGSNANGGVGGQFKYLNFSPDLNGGLTTQPFGIYWDYPLFTSERVRFEIPFALTIPHFQHVWTDWPWNKSRKTLTTDLIFTKIEFRVTYDTTSEYKTKFYTALDLNVSNNYSGADIWLDRDKTKKIPQGYLAIGGNYFITGSGGFSIISGKRKCQTKILIASSENGTVSSTYPTTASGYGDYNFNQDVSYITLDASPNYPIVFDRWEGTDFDGNTTTIGFDSTINLYNGLYQSVKPIFTSGTPSPTPSPSPEYDYYTADVFVCGDCSASTETIVVAFTSGSLVALNQFYIALGGPDGFAYRITGSTSAPGSAYILTTAYGSYSNCSVACFI